MIDHWNTWVRRTAAIPFEWAEWDCALEMADWVRERTGIDFGAKWRGRYGDGEAARALLRADGGIVAVMRQEAATAQILETETPRPGDVGVVRIPWLHEFRGRKRVTTIPAGAIVAPTGKWRARAQGGHVFGAFPLIVAWRL